MPATGGPGAKIEELIASVKNSVEAKRVYAEPCERNGVTVPIAPASSPADKPGRRGHGPPHPRDLRVKR